MIRLTSYLLIILLTCCCTQNGTDGDIVFINKQLQVISDTSASINTRRAASIAANSYLLDHKINDSLTLAVVLQTSAYDLVSTRRILKKLTESAAVDAITKAKAHHLLAKLLRQQNIIESFDNFYKAKKLLEPLDENLKLAEVYVDISYLYLDIKDFVESEKYTKAALVVATDLKEEKMIYHCYDLLSRNSYELANYTEALRYANLAHQTITDHSAIFASAQSVKALELIADIYLQTSQLAAAEKRYLSSLELATSHDDRQRLLLKIAELNLMEQKNVRFNEVLSATDQENAGALNKHKIKADLLRTNFYLSNFNSDRALQTAADAFKLARQLNCAQLQLEALHLLVNLDKINSQKNAREYIRLFDSIQFAERQIQTKCARIAFNTDELAKEKEAAIEQARVVAGSSIVAILTLLLITIIIRQALQQRQLVLAKRQIVANKDVYINIADQKMAIDQLRRAEESRIAAGLSTGIINRLRQTQKNLLILEEKTDHETIDRCQQYIDDLQNIEKEVRNVSHDLNHEMFSGNSSFNTILDQLTDSFQNKPAAIFKEIEESVNWDVMESAVKMNLHIILQKLLKNISKYSVPRHIFVTITSKGGILQMIILEDGNGYSQKRAHGRADTKNIFERVTSRNGNIDIQTRVGKGTTIIVNLPLRSL
ncbi:MAG TPA: hypothetical protein VGB44_07780 [Flavobacterium sp.]|jgi:signal transduction histidine kinase